MAKAREIQKVSLAKVSTIKVVDNSFRQISNESEDQTVDELNNTF